VERKFASVRQWKYLDTGKVDDVFQHEKMLDIVMALENLNTLFKTNRMSEVLEKKGKFWKPQIPRNSELRIFTPLNGLQSQYKLPKQFTLEQVLSVDHINQAHKILKNSIVKLQAQLKHRKGRLVATRKTIQQQQDGLFTPATQKRGRNAAEGGSVLQIQLGISPEGTLLLFGSVAATMFSDNYLIGMQISNEGILNNQCSCAAGCSNCSHSNAVLTKVISFATDSNEKQNLQYGLRKSKKTKPDLYLRKERLELVVEEVKRSAKFLCIHPDPICQPKTPQYCFCGALENQSMIQCSICDEWFHYRCLKMTSKEVNDLQQFVCGWCNGRDESQALTEDDLLEQEWDFEHFEIKMSKKLEKLNPSVKREEVPLGFKEKDKSDRKKSKHAGYVGLSSFGMMALQLKEVAKETHKRRKKAKETARAKKGQLGHHQGDAQGVGGLEAVPLNDHQVEQIINGDFD
jgi:hypothetical protein